MNGGNDSVETGSRRGNADYRGCGVQDAELVAGDGRAAPWSSLASKQEGSVAVLLVLLNRVVVRVSCKPSGRVWFLG